MIALDYGHNVVDHGNKKHFFLKKEQWRDLQPIMVAMFAQQALLVSLWLVGCMLFKFSSMVKYMNKIDFYIY